MTAELQSQARRLYETFSDLMRRYQFRDREQICCHGLSVSQCYSLETLDLHGSMTMGELAASLCLKISSMTRVIDALVERGLVRRIDDPDDRRVCRVQLTPKGRALLARVQGGLIREYEQVLRDVPSAEREAVIRVVGDLLTAYEKRCGAEVGAACCE